MTVVEMYEKLTFLFLIPAVILHLMATLELAFRFFSWGWFFKAAETSAKASKVICYASVVFGALVARSAVPTSLTEVFLLTGEFLLMIGMGIGYFLMTVKQKKNWLAPSGLITTYLRKPGEQIGRYDNVLSSLLFGWAQVGIFGFMIARMVFGF